MNLRQRSLVVEPVKRLRDDDHVSRTVGQRQTLGRSLERLDPGDDLEELRTHLRHRLDCDHACTGRRQKPRQLPGAGSDIDDGPPRPEPGPLGEPLDRLDRVRRPRALIDVRPGAEAGRRDRMDVSRRGHDGVTRYASNTASRLRSAVRSVRRLFRSPTSAVYQFFAS